MDDAFPAPSHSPASYNPDTLFSDPHFESSSLTTPASHLGKHAHATGDDVDSDGNIKDQRQQRRKIQIEYIQDKSRRHITFSKRKAGIMKKAYELSTLTGTQVFLMVVSETGLVYTVHPLALSPLYYDYHINSIILIVLY